jgi:Ca-activated chloride channel family protein
MEASRGEVENRVVFLTDAEPNAGDTSDTGLLARIKALALDGVYTTIIGGWVAQA